VCRGSRCSPARRSSTRAQQSCSEGFFAITALTYKDRYVLDLLGRRDGSSLFGADERWQRLLPDVRGVAHGARELVAVLVIIEFKPRYSVGTAGGRPGFNYQYQAYTVEQGRITPKILGNSKLKPELSTEKEYGPRRGESPTASGSRRTT
jgi:hypothetical protein